MIFKKRRNCRVLNNINHNAVTTERSEFVEGSVQPRSNCANTSAAGGMYVAKARKAKTIV